MFTVPEDDELHPIKFYEHVVEACTEHEHLREHKPSVAFLLRNDERIKAGRKILGTVYLPSVQGELRPMFDWLLEEKLGYLPTFLMVLDRDWWLDRSDREREILMFHEMCHMAIATDRYGTDRFDKATGEPVWTIRGHSVEEFNEVVARYGAWNDDLVSFLAAARDGGWA